MTKSKSQATDDDIEVPVEPPKPKRAYRKTKVTFSNENIPQSLNDSSDKENTIETSNRGRKTRSKKDENTAHEVVESRTRGNRKANVSEDRILAERSSKKTEKSNEPVVSSANAAEESVNAKQGRRTTRSARKATKEETVIVAEPKKEVKVVLEAVEVKKRTKTASVEPKNRAKVVAEQIEEPKRSSKRTAKTVFGDKTGAAEKTVPSKRPKSEDEEDAVVGRRRARQKEAPVAEATNNTRPTRNRHLEPVVPENTAESRSSGTPTLRISITRADVPKTKATKRAASRLDEKDASKRRRLSLEEAVAPKQKSNQRGKPAEKEQTSKTKGKTSRKDGKATDGAAAILQDSSVTSSKGGRQKATAESKKTKKDTTPQPKKSNQVRATSGRERIVKKPSIVKEAVFPSPRVTRSQKPPTGYVKIG